KRLDVPRLDALLSAVAIEIPEAPVGANHSFVEGDWSFGSAQQPATKPAFETVRISDDRRQSDKLRFHAVASPHPQQSQNELQIRSPALISNHLDFIDNDGSDLFEYVGIRQRDGAEFLVSKKRNIISPAQQWTDIVSLA